jgi:DNA-directed RNA polymerase specialized sigma24 family protein
VPPQDREDRVSELICHFCKDSFRVLRKYQDRGRPFAAWFLHVANNFLHDRLSVPGVPVVSTVPNGEDGERESAVNRLADPRPNGIDQLQAREWKVIVNRCLSRMSKECQSLIKLALIDGLKPLEIIRIWDLPEKKNKDLGTRIRDCRRSLAKKLIDEGLDPRWFVRPKRARPAEAEP